MDDFGGMTGLSKHSKTADSLRKFAQIHIPFTPKVIMVGNIFHSKKGDFDYICSLGRITM